MDFCSCRVVVLCLDLVTHVHFNIVLKTSETILCLSVTAPVRLVRHDRWDRGVFYMSFFEEISPFFCFKAFQVGWWKKTSPDRYGKTHFSGTKPPKLVFFFFLSFFSCLRVGFEFRREPKWPSRFEIILSVLPQKAWIMDRYTSFIKDEGPWLDFP